MSNNLPWFTESCAQDEIRLESDGTYTFYSRWNNLSDGYDGEMDRRIICSNWESGRCAIEFLKWDYTLGAQLVVDTDYESYEIRFSKATFMGIDYMEAVWVGAREPLSEGTPEYDAWYDKVSSKMEKYLPSYPMYKLSAIEHNPECEYQLSTDYDTSAWNNSDSDTGF